MNAPISRPARRLIPVAVVAASLALSAAHAKLDPPSPEAQAAAAKKREMEQEQIKRAQQALTRVQDEVAARYRREHPQTGSPQPAGETPKDQMPRAVRDVPREAGPHGRDEPGAEAHSAPAGTPQPPGKR